MHVHQGLAQIVHCHWLSLSGFDSQFNHTANLCISAFPIPIISRHFPPFLQLNHTLQVRKQSLTIEAADSREAIFFGISKSCPHHA